MNNISDLLSDLESPNDLYKLHSGHHVFDDDKSDDSSPERLSPSIHPFDTLFRPPAYTYEELRANLVEYDETGLRFVNSCLLEKINPTDSANCTSESRRDNAIKRQTPETIARELSNLISQGHCYICYGEERKHRKKRNKKHKMPVHLQKVRGWIEEALEGVEQPVDWTLLFCQVCNLPLTGTEEARALHYSDTAHIKKARCFCFACLRTMNEVDMGAHCKSSGHLKNCGAFVEVRHSALEGNNVGFSNIDVGISTSNVEAKENIVLLDEPGNNEERLPSFAEVLDIRNSELPKIAVDGTTSSTLPIKIESNEPELEAYQHQPELSSALDMSEKPIACNTDVLCVPLTIDGSSSTTLPIKEDSNNKSELLDSDAHQPEASSAVEVLEKPISDNIGVESDIFIPPIIDGSTSATLPIKAESDKPELDADEHQPEPRLSVEVLEQAISHNPGVESDILFAPTIIDGSTSTTLPPINVESDKPELEACEHQPKPSSSTSSSVEVLDEAISFNTTIESNIFVPTIIDGSTSTTLPINVENNNPGLEADEYQPKPSSLVEVLKQAISGNTAVGLDIFVLPITDGSTRTTLPIDIESTEPELLQTDDDQPSEASMEEGLAQPRAYNTDGIESDILFVAPIIDGSTSTTLPVKIESSKPDDLSKEILTFQATLAKCLHQPKTDFTSTQFSCLIMYIRNFKLQLNSKGSGDISDAIFDWSKDNFPSRTVSCWSLMVDDYDILRLVLQYEVTVLISLAKSKPGNVVSRNFKKFNQNLAIVLYECDLINEVLGLVDKNDPVDGSGEFNINALGDDAMQFFERHLVIKECIKTLKRVVNTFHKRFYNQTDVKTLNQAIHSSEIDTILRSMSAFKGIFQQVLERKRVFHIDEVFEALWDQFKPGNLYRDIDPLWTIAMKERSVSCEEIFSYFSQFTWKLLAILKGRITFGANNDLGKLSTVKEPITVGHFLFLSEFVHHFKLHTDNSYQFDFDLTEMRALIMFVRNLKKAVCMMCLNEDTSHQNDIINIFEFNESHYPSKPLIVKTLKLVSERDIYKLLIYKEIDEINKFVYDQINNKGFVRAAVEYFGLFNRKLKVMLAECCQKPEAVVSISTDNDDDGDKSSFHSACECSCPKLCCDRDVD